MLWLMHLLRFFIFSVFNLSSCFILENELSKITKESCLTAGVESLIVLFFSKVFSFADFVTRKILFFFEISWILEKHLRCKNASLAHKHPSAYSLWVSHNEADKYFHRKHPYVYHKSIPTCIIGTMRTRRGRTPICGACDKTYLNGTLDNDPLNENMDAIIQFG